MKWEKCHHQKHKTSSDVQTATRKTNRQPQAESLVWAKMLCVSRIKKIWANVRNDERVKRSTRHSTHCLHTHSHTAANQQKSTHSHFSQSENSNSRPHRKIMQVIQRKPNNSWPRIGPTSLSSTQFKIYPYDMQKKHKKQQCTLILLHLHKNTISLLAAQRSGAKVCVLGSCTT